MKCKQQLQLRLIEFVEFGISELLFCKLLGEPDLGIFDALRLELIETLAKPF
jgi:hypothetical protein